MKRIFTTVLLVFIAGACGQSNSGDDNSSDLMTGGGKKPDIDLDSPLHSLHIELAGDHTLISKINPPVSKVRPNPSLAEACLVWGRFTERAKILNKALSKVLEGSEKSQTRASTDVLFNSVNNLLLAADNVCSSKGEKDSEYKAGDLSALRMAALKFLKAEYTVLRNLGGDYYKGRLKEEIGDMMRDNYIDAKEAGMLLSDVMNTKEIDSKNAIDLKFE